MFKQKSKNKKNNMIGHTLTAIRKELKLSQNKLAAIFQVGGLNLDKNAIQRLESGERFITDIELAMMAGILNVDVNTILDTKQIPVVIPVNTEMQNQIKSCLAHKK